MSTTPRTSIRVNKTLQDAMSLNGPTTNITDRLTVIADRYAEMVRRSLPDLSEAEMNAVRDALKGTYHSPAAMIRGSIWVGVEDSLFDGLAEKWQINGKALVAKLKRLTYPEELALVESVEAYWANVARQRGL